MDLSIYLNAITALFVVVDPIGAAIIFHTLLPSTDQQLRRKTALKATVISLSLLLLFGNYGEPLLAALGIQIDALRISGGLLLFYTAFRMITQPAQDMDMQTGKDISVYPMSIPMLAGPGTLTLSILLFSQSGEHVFVSVASAMATILILTFILMLLSAYVKLLIRETGDEILRRFLGVILAALAIQFVYDGVSRLTAGG